MPPLTDINKKLKAAYGRNIANQQLFRVIWSDDQTEKRFGKFAEFAGSIFLREFSGLREVPKYSYIKSRYVLERWIPPMFAHTHEIPETAQGSYESIFVFEDANGNPLPVIWEKITQYIWYIMHPNLPGHAKELTQTQDEKAIEKEIEFNKMVLEDQGRSWIGHRLHSGEGVVVL